MKKDLSSTKEKGIILIQKYPEISSLVFHNFCNTTMTYQNLYPDKYKMARETPRNEKGILQKSLNNPSIQECFKCWKDSDFLETDKIYRERKGKPDKKGNFTKNKLLVDVYRLNLEPLFYLFEKKYSHVGAFSGEYIKERFTQEERNILNFFFNSDLFRIMIFDSRENPLKFLEEIPKLYLSWLYIPYLEYLAKKDKNILNKKLKEKVLFPSKLLKEIVNYRGKEMFSFIEFEASKLSYEKAIPYFLYCGHFDIENLPKDLDYFDLQNQDDLFLVFYSQLKEKFPKIMEELDKKMNMMLFLDPEGILWEE